MIRCKVCGLPINEEKELLTRICIKDGDAHFDCYYAPGALGNKKIKIPRWVYDRLKKLGALRIQHFSPSDDKGECDITSEPISGSEVIELAITLDVPMEGGYPDRKVLRSACANLADNQRLSHLRPKDVRRIESLACRYISNTNQSTPQQ